MLKRLNIFVFLFLVASCSSVNVTEEIVSENSVSTVEVSVKKESKSYDAVPKALMTNATVYFDFDRYNLSSKSIQTLKSTIAALKENPDITIVISGHADERGTREYNLALGQRRAEAVRDYLILNGVNKNRINVKSFGEEKPLVNGSDERSWARNRRAEIN